MHFALVHFTVKFIGYSSMEAGAAQYGQVGSFMVRFLSRSEIREAVRKYKLKFPVFAF